MKLGNSARFNYWLRWRVGYVLLWNGKGPGADQVWARSQGLTIAAAAYYGGVAYTRSQQEQYQKKQLVLLGKFIHPQAFCHGGFCLIERLYRRITTQHTHTESQQ